MTLHEAILEVLKKHNRPLNAKDICSELNRDLLYSRSDGAEIPEAQIIARIGKYQDLFFIDEKGLINAKRNKVKELLSSAWKIQDEINKFFKDKPFYYPSDYFVPLLFFVKRMVDNPQKSLYYFDFEVSKNMSFEDSFIQFMNKARDGFLHSKEFDFEKIKNENLDFGQGLERSIFFYEVEVLDLREEAVTSLEFGTFFNELICTVTRQNSKSGQFSTPSAIGKLIYELGKNEIQDNITLYNPAAGFATLPVMFSQLSRNKISFYGEELNQRVYSIASMNLIANDLSIEKFKLCDSLLPNYLNQKFNIIISVPPIGKTIHWKQEYENSIWGTRDITLQFLYLIISKLKQGGKALVIIPENILFNKGNEYVSFRNKIIEERLLEGIISLPPGAFKPFHGLKTSLLILSRNDNEESILIDAENPAFFALDEKSNAIILDSQAIALEYGRFLGFINKKNAHELTDMVMEDEMKYGKARSVKISLNNILENKVLSINKYLIKKDYDEGKTPLSEILYPYMGGPFSRQDLNYVSISDLNKKISEFYLDERELKEVKDIKAGRIADIPLLLISSIPPNVRATYFKCEGKPIVISRSIYSLRVDQSRIDIEYLVLELNSLYIRQFVDSISTGGTSLRRFSLKDFLSLRIDLPELSKQKEIVKLKKETLLSEKLSEAREFAEKSGLSGKNEIELLGVLKHEIGNITGGISLDIKTLQSFLFTKGVDPKEKISDSSNSTTTEAVFQRINNNISDIENMMFNIQSIIDFGNSKIKKEPIKFKEFFKKEVNKLSSQLKINNTRVIIGIDEDYTSDTERDFLIDSKQFQVLLRNYILNSIKHGYSSPKLRKTLVINLNQDDDFFYLSLINDGEPFPSDFSLEDFLSFGGRSGTQKGSGLGGYLIGKVVRNHQGTIELMKSGTALFLDGPLDAPRFVENNVIKVGVHFYIKLPKD